MLCRVFRKFYLVVKKNRVYICILLVCILIRLSPWSIGNSNYDEVLNDIAIGAIASTVVAWLINWRAMVIQERKNRVLAKIVLLSFAHSLTHYMDRFCFKCAFMSKERRSEKKKFNDWLDEYYKRSTNEKDPIDPPFLDEEYKQLVDSIYNQANLIIEKEIWLITEEIFRITDIDELKKIRLFASGTSFLVRNISAKNIYSHGKALSEILETSETYKQLLEIQYSCDFRLNSALIKQEEIKIE